MSNATDPRNIHSSRSQALRRFEAFRGASCEVRRTRFESIANIHRLLSRSGVPCQWRARVRHTSMSIDAKVEEDKA